MLQQLPEELLRNALVALEAASGGESARGSPRAVELHIASWKQAAGQGVEALQIGLYCLQHSNHVRARYFACSLLSYCAPNVLARGLLPVQDVWNIRTQLLHQAIAFRTGADTRLLLNAATTILGTITVAGFALLPEDAPITPESSQSGATPRGFSSAARTEVANQLDALLSLPAADAASIAHCHVGLSLASELIDRFDDRNALGALKLRQATATKMLSWPEMQRAKREFADHLLPHITSRLLQLVEGLINLNEPDKRLLELAVSALSAAFDFHHDEPTDGSRQAAAALLPGVYGAESTMTLGDEGDEGRPAPRLRPLNPAMAQVVLQVPVIQLVGRTHAAILRLQARGAAGDEEIDDSSAAQQACESCLEALASFSSPSLTWTSALVSLLGILRNSAPRQNGVTFSAHMLRLILALAPSTAIKSDHFPLGEIVQMLHAVGQSATRGFVPVAQAGELDLDEANEVERTSGEAFEEICDAWLGAARMFGTTGGLEQGGASLFTSFLDAKLEGARVRELYEAQLPETEDEDVKAGLKDRVVFRETLLALAMLGRTAPHATLARMHEIIGQLSARMLNLIHRAPHPSDPPTDVHSRELELHVVQEQTHWVILIAGFLLADEGAGETPTAPSDFLAVSSAKPMQDDDLVQIAQSLLHLFRSTVVDDHTFAVRSHLTSSHIMFESRQAERCSSQITEDLLWFIGRWSRTYLLVDSDISGPTSPNLHIAFNGDGGLETLHHVLVHFRRSLVQWSGDEQILLEMAHTLSSMAKSKSLCCSMVRLRSYAELVELVLLRSESLPAETVGALWSACLRCVSTSLDVSEGRVLFDEVVGAIESRTRALLENPDLHAHPQRPDILAHVNGALDIYRSLVDACAPTTAAHIVPSCIAFCGVAKSFLTPYYEVLDTFDLVLGYFERLATLLSEGFVDFSGEQLQTLMPIFAEVVHSTWAGLTSSSWDAKVQQTCSIKLLDLVLGVVSFAEGIADAEAAFVGASLPPMLAALSAFVAPDQLSDPIVLQHCVRTWRACLRVFPDQVDAALAIPEHATIEASLQACLLRAMQSLNEDDVRAGLEASEALVSAFAARASCPSFESLILEAVDWCTDHLQRCTGLVQAVFRHALRTLCFDPFAASFASDYLHLVQLCLLGLSRHDGAALNEVLTTVVAEQEEGVAGVGEAVRRLVETLTRSDAVESAVPGRDDRGKLARGARDEAFAVLRELRLQIRL